MTDINFSNAIRKVVDAPEDKIFESALVCKVRPCTLVSKLSIPKQFIPHGRTGFVAQNRTEIH